VCGQFGQKCMDCTHQAVNHVCGMPLHNICL
jgi:hypothetical protein